MKINFLIVKNSLYSGITNQNGVINTIINIDKNTTIYAEFNGTSDYNSCVSNSLTIIKATDLTTYLLDIQNYQLSGSESTIYVENQDTLCLRSTNYAVQTTEFTTSNNYVLTLDYKVGNNYDFMIGLGYKFDDGESDCLVGVSPQFYNIGMYVRPNFITPSYSRNGDWHTLTITRNGDYFKLDIDDGDYTYEKISPNNVPNKLWLWKFSNGIGYLRNMSYTLV